MITHWLQTVAVVARVAAMKKDAGGAAPSPPPHRGGEIVRGLPCVKRLNQLYCDNGGGFDYPT